MKKRRSEKQRQATARVANELRHWSGEKDYSVMADRVSCMRRGWARAISIARAEAQARAASWRRLGACVLVCAGARALHAQSGALFVCTEEAADACRDARGPRRDPPPCNDLVRCAVGACACVLFSALWSARAFVVVLGAFFFPLSLSNSSSPFLTAEFLPACA